MVPCRRPSEKWHVIMSHPDRLLPSDMTKCEGVGGVVNQLQVLSISHSCHNYTARFWLISNNSTLKGRRILAPSVILDALLICLSFSCIVHFHFIVVLAVFITCYWNNKLTYLLTAIWLEPGRHLAANASKMHCTIDTCMHVCRNMLELHYIIWNYTIHGPI